MAKRVGVDKWMFFTTLLLVVAGLAMVFSASAVVAQERYHSPYTFVVKQALWALCGVLAMLVLMHVDYSRLQLAALHLSRALRYHCSAGAGLSHSRLAPHPPLDSLRQFLHLSAVGDCQAGPGAVSGVVSHTRLDAMRDWKHTLLRAVAHARGLSSC